MAVDDVYTLQLTQRYAGQVVMNILAFRMKVAAIPTPALVTALATDWKDAFLSSQVTTLTYTGWVAQQVRGGTVSYTSKTCVRQGGMRLEGSYTGATSGSLASDGMPPQSAIVTTLTTGFSGRSRRGRHYLCGFSETVQTDGTIAAGIMTTYQNTWNTQITQYGVAGTDPNFELGVWSMRIATGCVPSKTPGGGMEFVGPSDPAAAYTGVTSATARNIVYSQRRRTIGVGR